MQVKDAGPRGPAARAVRGRTPGRPLISPMPNKSAKANVRKTVAGLVQAAAGGRADLEWLAKAVRKAGYAPAAEVLTRTDLARACAALAEALLAAEAAATDPAAKEALRRAIEAITALAAGK